MKNSIQKVTVMLLTCTLLGSPLVWMNTPSAYAEATATAATPPAVSKDQAVQKARNLLNLADAKWKLEASEYNNNADEKYSFFRGPYWQLNFVSTDSDPYSGYSVMLSATTGQMLSAYHFSKSQDQGDLTKEQARSKAENLVAAVAPDQFKETELTWSNVSGLSPYRTYTFMFERKTADGLFVIGDQISVTINGDGTLQSYNINWSNATFPKAEGTLSLDAVTKSYSNDLALNLQYQFASRSTPTAKPSVDLIYSTGSPVGFQMPVSQYLGLYDAKTGKSLGMDGKERTQNKINTTPLVPNGPKNPQVRATPLTQEEAEAVIRSSGLLVGNEKLNNVSYSEGTTKTWTFNLQGNDSTDMIGNVQLDASTGEVIYFNTYSNNPVTGAGLSEEAAKTKSLDLVKKLFPNQLGALALIGVQSPNYGKGSSGEFNNKAVTFGILKNGVLTQETIQIVFNSQGNVSNLYNTQSMKADQEDLAYADPTKAISQDQAKEIFVKNRPLRLSYYFPVTAEGVRSTTPTLVYAPLNSERLSYSYINAVTGNWVNSEPGDSQNPPVMPTDITGHWAEKSLTQFADLGLLELKDGKANPDQEITRGEWIRLLANFRGGLTTYSTATFSDVAAGSKYFSSVENAVRNGWIAKDTNFNPDEKITRQEAASIIARVMGYEQLAKHGELFVVPFSDRDAIAPWAKGSVAIIGGLGVMGGSGNAFHPNANITLAEACTAMLKMQVNDQMIRY